TRFEPWQQGQCVVVADELAISCRKTDLHHAFSRLGERHERIVAAEENMRRWDETRERRNRWSIGRAGDIVIEAVDLIVDSVGCLFGNVLGSILVHTTEH